MAREFTLKNLPPSDVKNLRTRDAYCPVHFEKKGKKWVVTQGESYGRTEFNNVGDLFWEWGQFTPLVEILDPLEEAKAYFKNNALIQTSLRDDIEARRKAKVIIESVVGK